jgi:hypothetical protein
MRRVAIVALVLLLAQGMTGAAEADFGFVPGSTTVQVLDGDGFADPRAGVRPDRLRIGFELSSIDGGADGNVKELRIELPPGVAGSPTAVPLCPRKAFDGTFNGERCPDESQVGEATALLLGLDEVTAPIFNVAPAPGQAIELGFVAFSKVPIWLRLRPDDFGITVEQTEISQTLPLLKLQIDLWGVPADHQDGTSLPRRPFFTTPTRCDVGPLALAFHVRSWQQPDAWISASADTGLVPTGCDQLPFAPTISFGLDAPVVDVPSGASTTVFLPEDEDPDARANSHIRSLALALPDGVSISPGGVHGRSACSEAAFHHGEEEPAGCPQASRIGSVELSGPLSRDPLAGEVYLGGELPGDRFRLFVVARGAGIEAKLLGSIRADPGTGRLTAELNELPQIPLERMTLRFDGGPRAVLATPLECGPATTKATFVPYSGTPPVTSSDAVSIGAAAASSSCAAEPPFAPTLEAGTWTRRAGRATAFSTTLRRRDGEQNPGRFDVSLPLGLTAALGSVPLCDGPTAAAGTCPPASRIGSAVAEVGPGPAPAPLHGDVYLTGPYRGAPFGLSLLFHAAIGPFDFGTLSIRAALRLDPHSGRVSLETDPLPRLVEGIPVRFQTIGLDIDRPGFIRNPTSCRPQAVAATIVSAAGAVASPATPFFLRGCESLRFRPRASMRLSGRSQLRRGGHPGLRIGIKAPGGSTNLRRAIIGLPEELAFSLAGLRELCPRREALAGRCPANSSVGSATALTPLLSERMSGDIHVVQPRDDGLPDLWLSLKGMGVRLELAGETSLKDGRLSTRFAGLPDIPMSSLQMRFAGGERGVIELERRICDGQRLRRLQAALRFEGQNGAYRQALAGVGVPGGCPATGRRVDG